MTFLWLKCACTNFSFAYFVQLQKIMTNREVDFDQNFIVSVDVLNSESILKTTNYTALNQQLQTQ